MSIWQNCKGSSEITCILTYHLLAHVGPPTHLPTGKCKHEVQRIIQWMPVVNPLHTTLLGNQHYVPHKVVGVQLVAIGKLAWDDGCQLIT